MAITSTRVITITFTGGPTGTETISAAQNTNSAGQIQVIALSSGNNTITVPAAGTVPTAATIVPPVGNLNTLTLKGVNGDTGIAIHLTDPSTIAIASSVTSFVINASSGTNIQIYWS